MPVPGPGPHRPRGRVEEDPVEPGPHLRRRPAVVRPGTEAVREEREDAVRDQEVAERPPFIERERRRRHGLVAEDRREVQRLVVRQREESV